jgi:hypothetical protein
MLRTLLTLRIIMFVARHLYIWFQVTISFFPFWSILWIEPSTTVVINKQMTNWTQEPALVQDVMTFAYEKKNKQG